MSNRDVELLFEVSSMRFMPRVWRQFLNPPVANLAEHSFRVAWIALVLALREKSERPWAAVAMAMIHDLPETRAGDAHYLNAHYISRDEDAAMADALKDTSLHELEDLYKEFEIRETLEAKIVKDADNLDVEIDMMELRAQGHSVGEIWNEFRKRSVQPRLFTDSARAMWDEIHDADPHAWHLNGPNRFNSGDWVNEPETSP